MLRLRRSLAPFIVLIALAATLVFAATAAAEIKIGEGTSVEDLSFVGEADLLKGSVEYDSADGRASFTIATREPAESKGESERPEVRYGVGIATASFPCTTEGLAVALAKAEKEGGAVPAFPIYEFIAENEALSNPPSSEVEPAPAYSIYASNAMANFDNALPASKTVNGNVLTISGINAEAANGPFNCAIVEARASGMDPDLMAFSLTTKPEPPVEPVIPTQPSTPGPTATSSPVPSPPPPAGPAPAKLALAKPKPLVAQAGKWTTVKLTVTNSGGIAAGPVALKAKAPVGVMLKPKTIRLPALLPGQSWTVSLQVKLTAKAKKRSTIALTGTLPGLTATSSILVKSAG